MATNTKEESQVVSRQASLLSEDWLAVWLGFAIIGMLLLGMQVTAPTFKWAEPADLASKIASAQNVRLLGQQIGIVFLLSAAGVLLMGGNLARFAAGFIVVIGITLAALLMAGNRAIHAWGLEYVLFALVLGLFVSNVAGTPGWLQEAVRSEFFIKTGLVIYGATILFGEILTTGAFGLIQALAVVLVVWFFCFWVSRRLGVDDEFAAMLSTSVSICGVSAAIASCGAIQGDRRKLSYVTSLVLVVAAPMMVAMPWIAKTAGIPDVVAGAWLGGTLDTTGSVVAAGELISETAAKAGTVVKFSQNILIGLAAFLLALWWTVKAPAEKTPNDPHPRPTAWVIWERFPKFVLGFLAASLLFSFAVPDTRTRQLEPVIKSYRTLWFAMAFACIGLETRFMDLIKLEGGRPACAFLIAQLFNVIWTLLLAYLLFGGVLWPAPSFH